MLKKFLLAKHTLQKMFSFDIANLTKNVFFHKLQLDILFSIPFCFY